MYGDPYIFLSISKPLVIRKRTGEEYYGPLNDEEINKKK